MRLDRIRLEDIRPDGNNPRTEFGDLDALAASMAWTPGRPGEPVNPLYVAQDGNVYRILDGERRYRAMSKAGKVDACQCLVAEDASDVETMLVMIATDDKRQLSTAEKEKGVQQAMLLGIDEDGIADVSQVDRARLRKARKAVSSIGHVTQLSLQSLAEIGELEDPGDVKAVEDALAQDASMAWDTPWRKELRTRGAAQRARKQRAEVERAIADAGIPVAQSDPEEAGLRLYGYAGSAEMVGKRIAEVNAISEERDCRCAVWLPPLEADKWGRWNAEARFYVEPAEDPEAERLAARSAEGRRLDELLDSLVDARCSFLVGLASDVDLSRMPSGAAKSVSARLWEAARGQAELGAFEEATGATVPQSCGPLVVALAWAAGAFEPEFSGHSLSDAAAGGDVPERIADMMRDWLDLLELLEQVGYDAGDGEFEIRSAILDVLATYGAEGDGEARETAAGV